MKWCLDENENLTIIYVWIYTCFRHKKVFYVFFICRIIHAMQHVDGVQSSKIGDPKLTRVSVKNFRFCMWLLMVHSNIECSIWISHGKWYMWHLTGWSIGRCQHWHASSFVRPMLWGRTFNATDQMLNKRICGWVCLKSSKSLNASSLHFHKDVSWLRTAVLQIRFHWCVLRGPR